MKKYPIMAFSEALFGFGLQDSYPELDQEKGVLGPPLIELLQATFLLRELVIDLADVHCLQQRVAVRGVRLSNVHKEVLAIL